MCPPEEGDFLPPIDSLPPRPSTMPPPAPGTPTPVNTNAGPLPPSFFPPAPMPPPFGAGDNMVLPAGVDPVTGEMPMGESGMQVNASQDAPAAEPPRRRGRRRNADAAEAVAAPAGQPLPPIGQPLTLPPPPIFGEGEGIGPGVPAPLPQGMVGPIGPEITMQASVSTNGMTERASIDMPRSPAFSPDQLEGPRFYVGLGTTVNLGNFENVKYDMGVSGVPVDATEAQLTGMMQASNARSTYLLDMLGQRLYERVREVKEARGIE